MKLVLVDSHPSIGGTAHDMTKESVMSQLLALAARPDFLAVIASPPSASFLAANSNGDGSEPCRDVNSLDGFL